MSVTQFRFKNLIHPVTFPISLGEASLPFPVGVFATNWTSTSHGGHPHPLCQERGSFRLPNT